MISRKNPLGRGIRFGIAEQNMAMMGAGLTQDILPGGYKPVSVFGTFAVFTNMMANAIRLAVIGNQLNPETKGFFICLAAHDGPETGEDGPTHQGMYWMSLYNALPGIKVYKPTDANETIEMLFGALEKGEPIVLSVYRPEQPVISRDEIPAAIEVNNGAYVYKDFSRSVILNEVKDPSRSDKRDSSVTPQNDNKKIVLAICGMQVLLNTLEILPELEAKGFDVKIIAVTSPELFEELRHTNPASAQLILPDEERPLVVTLHNGWPGFLYPFMLNPDYDKKALGITHYLKSGNVAEVYEVAAITPNDIKEKILNAIK